MYFSEVQIVEISFGHLWWNVQGFNKNWKVLFAKREFCFALSYIMCNIQVKVTLLVIWKLESVRHKHFVQKQEIFIVKKISVVVKDEEKAELFKRSHATIKTPAYF